MAILVKENDQQHAEAPLDPARRAGRRPQQAWKRRARRSLTLATIEATPASMSRAIVDNAVVPMAIALGATSFQIGLLGAVPKLLGAVAQLLTPRLMSMFGESRRVMYLSSAAGAVTYAAAAGVPLLPEAMRVWTLLVLMAVWVLFLEVQHPAWASWSFAQLLANRRGRYHALRQSLASGASIITVIAIGAYLDSATGRVLAAFSAVMLVAALLRSSSAAAFHQLRERPTTAPKIPQRDLARFVLALSQPNLRKVLFYSFGLQFGAAICGAYFTAYQLQVLGFSYTGLLLPTIVSAASGIVGLHFWGRMGDRSGNLGPIRLAAVGMGVLPLLWIWVTAPVHVALINVAGGFLWTGYNLCVMNYLCELSSPDDRANYVAYLTFFGGAAGFVGGLTGAGVLMTLPFAGAEQFIALFVISALVRWGAGWTFLPGMTEVRQVRAGSRVPEAECESADTVPTTTVVDDEGGHSVRP